MKNNFIIVFTIFFLAANCSQVFAEKPYIAIVKKIIDGDSLVIKTGQQCVEVRLYGIDCPEYGQPFSFKAKNFSRKIIHKKR